MNCQLINVQQKSILTQFQDTILRSSHQPEEICTLALLLATDKQDLKWVLPDTNTTKVNNQKGNTADRILDRDNRRNNVYV